jgi:hypothetical protein
VRVTATFDRLENGKFQEVSGDFSQDFFRVLQDPTSDPPAVFNGLQGTVAGKRLNVQ